MGDTQRLYTNNEPLAADPANSRGARLVPGWFCPQSLTLYTMTARLARQFSVSFCFSCHEKS